MSYIRRHSRLLLVAVCCAALGAGVSAIATAGATTSSSTATGAAQAAPSGGAAGSRAAGRRAGHAGVRRLAARAVRGDVVVRTKSGFATVTFERGKVNAVNGQQLTLTEGTRNASYKTVTLTIPANAVVRDDRHRATLAAVRPGQRVLVLVAPKHTYVIAHTPRAI